jgi:hypothetical protein
MLRKHFLGTVCSVTGMALLLVCMSCQQSSSEPATLAAPGNVSANAAWTYNKSSSSGTYSVNIHWNAVSGATGYVVEKYDSSSGNWIEKGTTGASVLTFSDSDVEKDDTCRYVVLTVNSAGRGDASDPAEVYVTSEERKTPAWLILYYGDGDNNWSGETWWKELSFSKGLASASADVAVVSLYDGSLKGTEQCELMLPSQSMLLAIKADSSADPDSFAFNGTCYALSAYNLSSTASWMTSTGTLSGNQEVDMASKDTLSNFLYWAQGQYGTDSEHTILIVSDHGAGPYDTETALDSRGACTDNTSGTEMLISSCQFPAVFKNAGYTTGKKLGMVIMDMCLESALEEAYEFKDYVHYYLSSPNSNWSHQNDYVDFMKLFTTEATLESIGKGEVAEQKSQMQTDTVNCYVSQASGWGDILTYCKKNTITIGGTAVNDTNVSYLSCGPDEKYLLAATATLTDLTKINDVAKAVDALAETILSGTPAQISYIRDNYLSMNAPLEQSLGYCGTEYCLLDIGYISHELSQYAVKQSWNELRTAAAAVQGSLSNMIVAAWRSGYTSNDTDPQNMYWYDGTTASGTAPFDNNWYGLTVCCGYRDWRFWYGNQTSDAEKDLTGTYASIYSRLDYTSEYPAWDKMLKTMLPAD